MELDALREQNASDAKHVLEALGLTPIHAVYGKADTDYSTPSDYEPLLKSLGFDIAVQVDEDAYAGTTYILYRTAAHEYGFLAFGWGSCSGCDALQGCGSWSEVEILRRRLLAEIKWTTNSSVMWLWLQDETIQTLKWHWGSVAFNKFIQHAAESMFGVRVKDPAAAGATGATE